MMPKITKQNNAFCLTEDLESFFKFLTLNSAGHFWPHLGACGGGAPTFEEWLGGQLNVTLLLRSKASKDIDDEK